MFEEKIAGLIKYLNENNLVIKGNSNGVSVFDEKTEEQCVSDGLSISVEGDVLIRDKESGFFEPMGA